MNGKTILPNCICIAEPSFRKKKSKTSFKKATRKKKQSKNTCSNIDVIDEKIEHCLQKAEDTFNVSTSLEEFSNHWIFNSAELKQDQAFIKYLEEFDETISEDELAKWSLIIDLFMEGLSNPDRLEALWEQSKAKKLWDDSHRSLDQHLSRHHLAEDSVSIEDYMSRWCNVVQTPNSPTPQEDHRMPQTSSSEKRDNLEKYNKFINELSVRIKGGWPLADHIPHDEDLL